MATSRKKATAAGPDRKTVTLAHPITNPTDMHYLGLEEKDGGYGPGEEVDVLANSVSSLLSAGYITVDPQDAEAVAELTGEAPPQQTQMDAG